MYLVNSDIHKTGSDVGLHLTGNTYVVSAGVEITALARAVWALDDSSLYNYGAIISTNDAGILDSGAVNFLQIYNEKTGLITGSVGVELGAASADITNVGSIVGTQGVGIEIGAVTYAGIVNDGYVSGATAGVLMHQEAGTLENTGLIEGADSGIDISTNSGGVMEIVNAGTIRGSAAITVENGRINLTNTGTLDGVVDLTAVDKQSDLIVNSGKILGYVYLGDGDDAFVGSGGTSGLVLGGGGSDRIVGGSGADGLEGGAGKDVLSGGAGADNFYFGDALDGLANVDRITDFSVPQDTIDLSHTIFNLAAGKLASGMFYRGAHAHDANDHVVYNPATGALLYDANGSAAGGEVKFAVLAHHLSLSAADFLVF